MGVTVREETTLQHLVRAGFDSRHQVSWREGGLLNLSKVIVGISVQCEATDGNQRVFFLRPGLGNIEWIKLHLLGFFVGHHLDEHIP